MGLPTSWPPVSTGRCLSPVVAVGQFLPGTLQGLRSFERVLAPVLQLVRDRTLRCSGLFLWPVSRSQRGCWLPVAVLVIEPLWPTLCRTLRRRPLRMELGPTGSSRVFWVSTGFLFSLLLHQSSVGLVAYGVLYCWSTLLARLGPGAGSSAGFPGS